MVRFCRSTWEVETIAKSGCPVMGRISTPVPLPTSGLAIWQRFDYRATVGETLAYVAAGLVCLWGVMHAVPTGRVVAGFEPITADNRRVLLQEWLAEAFTMWGVAALVIGVTIIGPEGADAVEWTYRASAGLLLALAVLTTFTGARTPTIWFKLCPVVKITTATLLVVASVL